MKKLVVLLMLVAVAFAVDTRIRTVLPTMEDNQTTVQRGPNPNNSAPENMPIIGRREVVGWTDYDWQFNGPEYNQCIVDPVANGVHVSWMYRIGADPRNMRYNFYDFATNSWNWATGVSVHTVSTGFGGMSADPITGNVVICAHGTPTGGVLVPIVARDQAAGAGLFEYSNPAITSLWPPVAVSHNQMIHVAASNNDAGALRDTCYYIRMTAWNTWAGHIVIHDGNAVPAFPTQNIAASRTSNKVVVVWQCSEDPYPERGFYRLSTDGGANWGAQTQIPFPPSTGIVPGYHISSFYPMFDNNDNLRIVSCVSDTGFTLPAEIWMYSPTLTQPWTLVHHYDADTLNAPVGYNAIFACRPSVCQATNGNFYVTWEQFDSLNFEPTLSLARADIHVAELTNNGQTVSRKGRITDPDAHTKRFPSIGGVKNDTIILSYLLDSVCGFGPTQGQGPTTNNPIFVHRLHVNSLPVTGIEEQPGSNYIFTLNTASPNPFNGNTRISYTLPSVGNVDLTVYDILGRSVRTLASGTKTAGTYNAIWDGRTNSGELAKSGVYFYTLKTADRSVSHKLIKTY